MFINFFWLLVFRHEVRETQFLLCWLTSFFSQLPSWTSRPRVQSLNSLTQQTRGASRRPQTGLTPSSFKSQLTSPSFGSQLTAFFLNHQESQPFTFGHDVICTPVPFPICGFCYDIFDCHAFRARAWTPTLNVCTCTCTKPNSSKPN